MHEQPIHVGVVSHTHWDREWYAPFQAYRVQLVHLLDELLDLLERDDTYARFLLDGQTAVLDDYLEVRPAAEARIAALVGAGRVQIGPWMVLMDEYMVSAETIVRDLQLGVARARELGGAMPVGYLPDMFGHVAQMPQILRLAGLEHAVVWRGVPSEVTSTAFWWEAPDGSRVRAEYLYGSYSNGRDIPNNWEQLVRRARGYELELGSARLPGGGMLLMNGSDHLLPQPWLGHVVDDANAHQHDYCFSITSLPDYLAVQPTDGLHTWRGELRSGARANVLMGVASNRVDVHQAAARAERAVERVAEPLSALYLPAEEYPDALLGIAWRNLVLDSAHDSSCACSHDEVVEAVRVRYQEARHIGEALAHDALRALATQVDAPPGSTIVVNPTRRSRSGMVSIPVAGEGPVHLVDLDGAACATQVISTTTGDGLSTTVTGTKIRWVLEMMRGPELAGAKIARVERRDLDDGTVELTLHNAGPGEAAIDLEATREVLQELGEAGATICIRQRKAPVRDVVFAAGPVPGFGWRSYRVAEGEGPTSAVRADGHSLANEHVRVEVSLVDGTYTLESGGVRVEGANRYVDGGDGGDTYNYSPPTRDTIVDMPESVRVEVVERGPVRARLLVVAGFRWPARAIGDERSCSQRSDSTVDVEIRTTLELRTGERFLRVRVEFDNQARDHRLRAHFPLPATVGGSDAECAFAVVHRGLTAEGGPHEAGLPTFVSRRFVDCSDSRGAVGLALVHDGLLEYEVVDAGRELALTLLRATAYLSRSEITLRPNPAGPLDPLEGPQLQGPVAVEYAVVPHHGDWEQAGLYDVADEVLVPLGRIRGGGWEGAFRGATGSCLSVEGAQVSAVTRAAAGAPLTVRVFNASAEASIARIAVDGEPTAGDVVDLLGAVQGPFTGELELGAWKIATVSINQ
ncbi:MAG: glycoside hydrolase family 38 C-terminal domain-containing protein [Acidimicrobiia bacterium]